MKIPHLPPNPNTGSPERHRTVRNRVALSLGGLVSAAECFYLVHNSRPLSGDASNFGFLFLVSVGVSVVPLYKEVQERTGGTDGGDWRKGWEPPLLPPDPAPSGEGIEFIREVEQYLADHQPVSV